MIFEKEQVLAGFQSRISTRYYDPSKKIPEETFATILECARLSPSSIGAEPWQFLVIQSPTLRQKLKPVSWGMATQVDDASHLVVILAKKNMRYDSEYIAELLNRRGFSDEQKQMALDKYKKFQSEDNYVLENERTLFDWTCKQSYIALANMMTSAAFMGIDSCAIEGFNYAAVNQILADAGTFDPQEWGVAVMVTFGYRAKPLTAKSKKPIEDVVRWIE